MRYELGVRDARAMVANFRSADAILQREVRASVTASADRTVRIMRRICPVDTGFMRAHIAKHVSASRLVFEVGWDASDFFGAGLAFYPFFVEYGTRFMRAQPTLRPAYAQAAPLFEADLRAALARAVERAAAAAAKPSTRRRGGK